MQTMTNNKKQKIGYKGKEKENVHSR